MKGQAIAHGAITVINAIATGKGSAMGIDLWTKAKVKLTDEIGVIKGRILDDPEESPILIEKAVDVVLRRFNLNQKFGAKVETESNIPIARGLKSSSTAANAITLATVAALDKRLDDVEIVKLGVEAAKEAKVTITGAFDDACASYFGGFVVTDNFKFEILKRSSIQRELDVVLFVPTEKIPTTAHSIDKMRLMAPFVDKAFNLAMNGEYLEALTINGLIYSAVLGYDSNIAIDALEAGATAAGLSGTGPAFAALVPHDKVDDVANVWKEKDADIIITKISNKKTVLE